MDSVNAHPVYSTSMRERSARPALPLAAALVFVGLLSSCSINQLAVRTVGGFLAGSGEGSVFTGDDDPELVRPQGDWRPRVDSQGAL